MREAQNSKSPKPLGEEKNANRRNVLLRAKFFERRLTGPPEREITGEIVGEKAQIPENLFKGVSNQGALKGN